MEFLLHGKRDLYVKGRAGERGFVLATSLVMLSLLTLLSLAMYYNASSAIETSRSAQQSTQAYYYAETAIHYMEWAWRNQAEFDSYLYTGGYVHSPAFGEPFYQPTPSNLRPSDAVNRGDRYELNFFTWDPGPTEISDVSPAGTSGQVLYFDNSPMANRAICWPISLCNSGNLPVMYHISSKIPGVQPGLPRYIRLDIDASGKITPEIPKLPHRNPPVVGQDIPDNGAVVWLTAGDVSQDYEIDPVISPDTPNSASLACSGSGEPPNTVPGTATGCDKTNSQWRHYSVVIYAIGYVDGRASRLLRAVIEP